MRKTLVLLAALVVALGLLSPAEAASKKKYAVTFSPTPKGGGANQYNDTSLDLSSGNGQNRTTTIRAKITGGPIKGKKVYVYATNLNRSPKQRVSLGSYTMTSSGVLYKKFTPGEGNGGVYKIEVEKKASNGRTGKIGTFNIRVFQFIDMATFYDDEASNPGYEPQADPPMKKLVSSAPKEKVGQGTNPYERWSTSYAIHGTGRAVFDFDGYNCFRFNLKLGVSLLSPPETPVGTFTVKQGDDTIMSQQMEQGAKYDGEVAKNVSFVEPTRVQSEEIEYETGPFTVSVVGQENDVDPTGVRFVLGLPKVSCTYPLIGTPKKS